MKTKTVNEMLTPGKNNHGISPGIGEHTFGHGGVDEDFCVRLDAWKDTSHAVMVMDNSENGSIIQEILLSIAIEYKLSGIEPIIRTIHKQSDDQHQRFAGKYNIPELGNVQISFKMNRLELSADFMPPLFYLQT